MVGGLSVGVSAGVGLVFGSCFARLRVRPIMALSSLAAQPLHAGRQTIGR